MRLIANELDQSLRLQTPGASNLVVLSNLVDAAGAAVPDAADKVAAFLVNIEREDVPTRTLQPIDAGQDRVGVLQPPVHLSLMVMFAANFSGSTYTEALKLIANTISFFQSRPVFNHSNTPALDDGIDQLSIEIENLGLSDLSNLWGVLGGRYVPSVLYRLRMITIDARRIEGQRRRVEQVVTDLVPTGAV